jgi:hypothetical protein
MKLNSEELKHLYQLHTARSGRRGLECLSAEMFIRAGAGELSGDERGRLADHLAECSDCSQEYRIVISSAVLLAQPIPRRAVRLAPVPIRLRWPAIVTTAVLVVIAVSASVIVWRSQQQVEVSQDTIRGAASIAIEVQPPNHALLDVAPRELSWSPVEAADSHQVSLYDFESTPIWESQPSAQTSVVLPEPVRQRLGRGQPFYWRVTARRGVERLRSELFHFVIRGD